MSAEDLLGAAIVSNGVTSNEKMCASLIIQYPYFDMQNHLAKSVSRSTSSKAESGVKSKSAEIVSFGTSTAHKNHRPDLFEIYAFDCEALCDSS